MSEQNKSKRDWLAALGGAGVPYGLVAGMSEAASRLIEKGRVGIDELPQNLRKEINRELQVQAQKWTGRQMVQNILNSLSKEQRELAEQVGLLKILGRKLEKHFTGKELGIKQLLTLDELSSRYDPVSETITLPPHNPAVTAKTYAQATSVFGRAGYRIPASFGALYGLIATPVAAMKASKKENDERARQIAAKGVLAMTPAFIAETVSNYRAAKALNALGFTKPRHYLPLVGTQMMYTGMWALPALAYMTSRTIRKLREGDHADERYPS